MKTSCFSFLKKSSCKQQKKMIGKYKFVKVLKKSNYYLYVMRLSGKDKDYVVKIYPLKNGHPSLPYQRESAFKSLTHPNIISILDCEPIANNLIGETPDKISYIVMELSPYGDFCDLLRESKIPTSDDVIRTYFHQLIEGVEYLHSKGLAHMNLKLENLLLDKDFNLRICDFKFSTYENKEKMIGKGTKNSRAPEVINSDNVSDPKMADIYSCGIILFALKAGTIPYVENKLIKDFNLFELMLREDDLFWEVHKEIQDLYMDFDRDFKELFLSLVRGNPKKRPTISQIKASKWYKGPIYSQSELTNIMKQKIAKIISPVKGKK